MECQSPIVEFYAGRSVLITGATGFMGKVLVEKLLRSCPGVHCLYLLMRPKRGHDVRHRLDELLSAPIFDELRRSRPECLRKVVAVPGDITLPELGLSVSDRDTLQEEVSVVFHSAATVKFDEALKMSVEMNLLGTRRIIQLCHQMKKLEALVHVSTAYCNCDRDEVDEMVYPAPLDYNKLVECVDWMDSDMASHMTPKVLGNRPNTYTFTKALAENAVIQESGKLPVAIVRPSIVTAAWKEPMPGWVDNLNGPTGLLVGAGKGVLRSLYCNRDLVADLIPVDLCINLLISVGWHTATARPNDIVVYNCVTGAQNPIKWEAVETKGLLHLIENPYSKVLWYPGGSFKSSRVHHDLCFVLFHVLPSYAMDAVFRLSGRKPMMVNLQKKVARAIGCLEFFTTKEWKFTNTNVQSLLQTLTPADRQTFDFDVCDLNWDAYINQYVLGTRKFVLKEDPSTFPEARAHLRKMYFIHRLSQFLTMTVFFRLVLSRSHVARRLWTMLLGVVARAVSLMAGLTRAALPVMS